MNKRIKALCELCRKDENFGEIYRYFYRNVDNIHFYCLVRKGETYGK